MNECPRCHAPIPDPQARFCANCGAPLEPPPAEPAPPPLEPESAPPPPPVWEPELLPGGASGPGPEGAEERPGTPWDRRSVIGLGAALVETSKQVIASPTRFFRAMPLSGGLGGPLLYATIVGYVGWVAAALYDFVFRTVMGRSFEGFGASPEIEKLLTRAPTWVELILQIMLGPVLVAVILFISSAITHIMLTLLGGARRGFEATFRVQAFARAVQLLQIVLGIIPVCGALLTLGVEIVVTVIGLSEAHGISRGKAAAAVLLPMLIAVCCLGILVGAAVWVALSALSGGQ